MDTSCLSQLSVARESREFAPPFSATIARVGLHQVLQVEVEVEMMVSSAASAVALKHRPELGGVVNNHGCHIPVLS